jgi:hypothetical protein
MAEPVSTAALATRVTALQLELVELTNGARKLQDNTTAGRAAGELAHALSESRKAWDSAVIPAIATLKARL